MNLRDRFDRWFRPEEFARREIDDEIRAHIAARIDYLVARGMSPDAARAEALRRFGDLAAGRAALVAQATARQHRLAFAERFDRLFQDIKYVVRTLARAPAFATGVIATLALGLGVNAAVFRVADHALYRPPAGVGDPDQVRWADLLVSFGGGTPQRSTAFSYPEAQLMAASGAFERASLCSAPRYQRDEDGRDVAISYVDDQYFAALRVPLIAGRSFDASEATPATTPRLAVLSYRHWQRRLGGLPLGEQSFVTLAGTRYRVVGVAAEGFVGIDADPIDVWLPMGDADFGRGTINGVVIPWHRSTMLRAIRMVGRVPRDGQATSVAQTRLTASLKAFEGSVREAVLEPVVPVRGAANTAADTQILTRLTVVAAGVLLIACANVANLLLARGLRRTREIGVRIALGASRARVMRLLVIESLTLACVGGAAAILLGHWTADALRQLLFPESRWVAGTFDLRTLLYVGALAVAGGVIVGFAPAIQSTARRLTEALKEGRSPGGRARRLRATVVVVQAAISLALLVGCGLLVRSLVKLHAIDLGFDPAGLVTLAPGRARVDEPALVQIAERIRHQPDVESVALASIPPFGATAMVSITVPGASFTPESSDDMPLFSAIDANYLPTMGIRVLQGRGFLPSDRAGAEPVAVVNESMARRYWGSTSPFASCILAIPNPCARIVGVVADVRDTPGGASAPMRFYVPLEQSTHLAAAIIVRGTPGQTATIASTLRAMVPGERPPTIEIPGERVRRALRPWSSATILFVALGAVALALACVGLYSVMSYLVAERLHEVGIRVALGATAGDVVRLVVGTGGRLVLVGMVAGCGLALGLARLMGSLLFEVSTVDPLVYLLAIGTLAAFTLAAMLPVARRAARTDAVEVLRAE